MHSCFNRNDLASFNINIRTMRTLYRKNIGLCLYSGICFDNCIFRFQTFQDVIPGKSEILQDWFHVIERIILQGCCEILSRFLDKKNLKHKMRCIDESEFD